MDDIKAVIVCALVAIVLCVGLGALAGPIVEVQQTQADTQQIEAQTTLTEAETEQMTLEALAGIIQDLLAELGAQRRFQSESLQEMTALLGQLAGLMGLAILGNLVLTAVLLLSVAVGVIVVAVALLQRKRSTVLVLPRQQAQPWLPVGDASIIPYQTQDAIQVVDVGQEIVIE